MSGSTKMRVLGLIVVFLALMATGGGPDHATAAPCCSTCQSLVEKYLAGR